MSSHELAPHHKRMIGKVAGKLIDVLPGIAILKVEQLVVVIVSEVLADRVNADAIMARDYRKFIIEALTLEVQTKKL